MYPQPNCLAIFSPSPTVIAYMQELSDYGFSDWEILTAGIRYLINPYVDWGGQVFDAVTQSYQDDLARFEEEAEYQKAKAYFSGYDRLSTLFSATVRMVADDYLDYRGHLLSMIPETVLCEPDFETHTVYVRGTCATPSYWMQP